MRGGRTSRKRGSGDGYITLLSRRQVRGERCVDRRFVDSNGFSFFFWAVVNHKTVLFGKSVELQEACSKKGKL